MSFKRNFLNEAEASPYGDTDASVFLPAWRSSYKPCILPPRSDWSCNLSWNTSCQVVYRVPVSLPALIQVLPGRPGAGSRVVLLPTTSLVLPGRAGAHFPPDRPCPGGRVGLTTVLVSGAARPSCCESQVILLPAASPVHQVGLLPGWCWMPDDLATNDKSRPPIPGGIASRLPGVLPPSSCCGSRAVLLPATSSSAQEEKSGARTW